MSDYTVDRFVNWRLRADAAMIEQAVEAAVQDGVCGVRVHYTPDGVVTLVDPTVPYGYIYEHDDRFRRIEYPAPPPSAPWKGPDHER